MLHRSILVVLMLMSYSRSLSAQQHVQGRIYSAITDSVIPAATVYNKKLKMARYAARDGSYRIFADEGDTLIFSAAGFIPDTVPVLFHLLLTPYDVTLARKVILLESVKVTSSYQKDSMERHNYYEAIFKKQPGITGYNGPEKGFGVVLSPLSYFSNASKQKRVLKRRLLLQDQEDYIDRAFPKEWVQRLTGLEGDSLHLFLYSYRPSYAFCRKNDRMGMMLYINDKLKEFRRPKKNRG